MTLHIHWVSSVKQAEHVVKLLIQFNKEVKTMDEINISEMIEKELEEAWLKDMEAELHGDHSCFNEDFR